MATAMATPEYITVEQASVIAGVSAMTVRRAIKKGELSYRATRGRLKFLRAQDVEEWARTRFELREIKPEGK